MTGRDGAPVALFIGDYFARPSKRSGAWMSGFREQQKLDGPQLPIVVNVMNFAKGGAGEPSLLSFDDVSDAVPRIRPRAARHAVGRDLSADLGHPCRRGFRRVSLAALRTLARAAGNAAPLRACITRTGEPMPEALLGKSCGARQFNQGFATVEFTASALVDLELHLDPSPADVDVVAFEGRELARIGMPAGIAMRHRTPHFQHIFSGGYSAAYYSYLWSEVLDADGFEAFEESGDIFDPDVAGRLRDFVYAAGSRRDYDEAYRGFRGRDPSPRALFRKRGLAAG